MRPQKKKLVYVPDNDVNVYDYESDGADEEIGVIAHGSRLKKYHYDDSRNSLSTRINQFILLCLSLIILYSMINPDNGIFGIVFKGSLCDHVINGATSIKNFVNNGSKTKVKNRKTAIKITEAGAGIKEKEKETVVTDTDVVQSEHESGSESELGDESEEEYLPDENEIPSIKRSENPSQVKKN